MTQDEKLPAGDMQGLLGLVRRLRAPQGCPWDRAQTHASLRKHLIEETYEVVEAIDTADDTLLCEELGDLLFQIAFHAVLAEERGAFSFSQVTEGIVEKMIRRHPHVFGDSDCRTEEQVSAQWEKIKSAEKARGTLGDKLNAVPRVLPALMRGQKIAAKSGHALVPPPGALQSLAQALSAAPAPERPQVLGQLLSALCRYAEACGLDAEAILHAENERLVRCALEQEDAGPEKA